MTWTPEMVKAAFALHAADYPKFFDDSKAYGSTSIVRTLIQDRTLFTNYFVKPRKPARVAILRIRGNAAWREQVYSDVAEILNQLEVGRDETT